MPAKRNRWSQTGIRPATCATSSKPFASPRREENDHEISASSRPCRRHRARRSSPLHAAPISYTLPEETAAFRPGPNLEVVQNNCTGCHSADYIDTQPRDAKSKKDFWQAEVTKMIKVYGAPIDDAAVGKIVEYLAATY